jgi:DNA segregation ATPase FtsK/SpoIIIE-like protein
MMQNFNVKLQLRLANPDENEMGGGAMEARKAARRTLPRPGFGLTESAHEMLIGIPVIADGAGAPVEPRDIGALVAGVAGVEKHTTLMRLPERVLLREVLAAPGAVDRSRPAITFAISEVRDLGPAPFALDAHPGLTIVGRQGCGKSTALAAIGEAVMARFSPQEAQLTIIDPNTGPLQHLASPEYVRDYAYGQDHIDEVLTRLATEVLVPRLPAEGLTQAELRALKRWEGPRHFVLIDDAQDLRGQGSGFPPPPPVGAVLWKLMERARQIGLHVFLTRTLASNWGPMEMDPWIKFQTQAKMPKLFMDNDPSNRITQGPQGIRAQALPPGRGLLLTNESEVEGILIGIPTILEEQTEGTD